MNRLHSVHPFEGYQSRFVAYCTESGYLSPVQQWAADRHNGPFMAWTTRKLKEWREATGYTGGMDDKHNAAFDAWLEASHV